METIRGKVILLVGPSCAGKSTLAAEIQATASELYLVMALDDVFRQVPDRWGSAGAFSADGFAYRFEAAEDEAAGPIRRIVYGDVGWRVLRGLHRAVAAQARAGVNVVVDDMLLDERVMADWAEALADLDVLLVSVTAPFDVLMEREAARTRRRTLELVTGHKALHDGVQADLVVDTSLTTPMEAARLVLGEGFPSGEVSAMAKTTPDNLVDL